jgi:hypothetical protein
VFAIVPHRLWTRWLNIVFWGSIILYVVFIIAWTLLASYANPSFFFAALIMFTR